MMLSIKSKKINSFILKLDLVKDCDQVNWDFLSLLLLQVGLSLQATKWVMGCVSFSNFIVLVNGDPTSFFKASHGFRQGYCLLPLLILFIVEGLSRLISNAKMEGSLKEIKLSRVVRVTH